MGWAEMEEVKEGWDRLGLFFLKKKKLKKKDEIKWRKANKKLKWANFFFWRYGLRCVQLAGEKEIR